MHFSRKTNKQTNLRNLSGFATARFANNNGGGMVLHQIKNGGAVLVHGKPLSQPLDTRIPKSATITTIEINNCKTTRMKVEIESEEERYPEEEE